MYFIKTPWWLKFFYSNLVWNLPAGNKEMYLTFDDGPHPVATPFVLDTLLTFKAKATFFCIGKNVVAYPEIYNRIIAEGHSIGNHTNTHLNGWKSRDEVYVENINAAKKLINSNLFRPPYGRIKKRQVKLVKTNFKIIMWDVLSGDFDIHLTPQKCLQNVTANAVAGSIVVFHDSQKAFERMEYALPKVLQFFSERGYAFKGISL